jgi:NHLM bacteriocin system ABC transporter peptidase/ATP-binding protein
MSHARVRTPERLQMEATECGAAALGMVLGHYGRWVPLEELRDACGINRDGSNALAVKRAAERYGLEARAQRGEPDALKQMTLPLIVFWRFNHFLVVEGWSGDEWYLNDPASGHRTCSAEEFDEAFTGIALQLTPGPEFLKGGHAPGTLRRLARFLVGSRDGVLLMAILGAILVIPQILVPGLAKLFVDSYAGETTITIPAIIAALVAAAILQAGLVGLQSSVGQRMALKVSALLSAAMMSRLLRAPAQFHALRGASTLAFRATQPMSVSDTVASLFSSVAVAIISSTTAAIVLVFVYWPVGLLALVFLALVVASQRTVMRRQRTLSMRMVREQSDVAMVSAAALAQVEVIKSGGAEDALVARWTRAHDRLLAATQELGERIGVVSLFPGAITTIAGVAVTLGALAGVSRGALSLGGLVAVQTLNGLVLGPVPVAVSQIQAAQSLTGQLDAIDDVLNTEPDPRLDVHAQDVLSAQPLPDDMGITGDLALVDVSFGYVAGAPALIESLSMRLTPGKRIALVGPSGCGKSTVGRLVAGWYQPWSGQVLIDGRPRDDWPEGLLCSHIAIVDQDPFVFAGTFRDNITMWNATLPEADVIRAATDAALHDDIVRRPGAYEAVLAEEGADLSGGQRQRLEMARALVRNPALIVLDEATSALDAATEAQIETAIRSRGMAELVIAHRLSTVRDCDEIIVLDAGRVVERGTHDDLLSQDGAYSRLVRS